MTDMVKDTRPGQTGPVPDIISGPVQESDRESAAADTAEAGVSFSDTETFPQESAEPVIPAPEATAPKAAVSDASIPEIAACKAPAPIVPTPKIYVNRELSWLSFNHRVLMEASDRNTPLYERLKFVSIYFSNLDEFFMIRVGGLSDRAHLAPDSLDPMTGWTPKEQLRRIFAEVSRQQKAPERIYRKLCADFRTEGIDLLDFRHISQADELIVRKFFVELRPLLSPQVVDKTHPFPFLRNGEQYCIAALARTDGKKESKKNKKSDRVRLGLIPLGNLPRFFVFTVDNCSKVALTADLVRHFAPLVFKKQTVLEAGLVRVTRNADISISESLLEYDIDFRGIMEKMLRKRKRLQPVRVQFSATTSDRLVDYVCDKLSVSRRRVFFSSIPLDFSFVFPLAGSLDLSALSHTEIRPFRSCALKKGELFPYLEKGHDLLLSFPYQSIQPFVDLLYEAADDPTILSIKITLYRLAGGSKIAAALAYAADRGKEVLCLLELRARFDEQNNIDYSKMLEKAGCQIIYGLSDYKVHSKLCLITRRVGDEVRYITQVGTGNYNEKTAELYTDLLLITADQAVGRDAVEAFHALGLGETDMNPKKLWIAPQAYKTRLLEMIAGETALGSDGRIAIKVNSLNDADVMQALTDASCAGVEVRLYIRGICCLLPGVPGYTDNICVKSVVGRYLEHSRIFVFGRGAQQRIFLGSGDLLDRNTIHRVEAFIEVVTPDTRAAVLEIMDAFERDDVKGWVMQPDGSYFKTPDPTGEASQAHLQDYFAAVTVPVAEPEPPHRESFWQRLKRWFS